MLLQELEKKELIKPPYFLSNNTLYLTRMGSVAYGVSTDNSDVDIYGVCIPPKDYIFPPNYIEGFDERSLTFHQWQQHHIQDKSANGGKGCKYDFSIYGVVNYFSLVMQNNPNVLDSLFVRREHIIHITRIWEIVRENKKIFLHKGVVHKMKGYAFSQLAKAKNSTVSLQPILNFEKEHGISQSTKYSDILSKEFLNKYSLSVWANYDKLWAEGMNKTTRFEAQKIAGFDLKFCYHIFRLADQAEFILNHHDLDLQESSRVEKMKAIRRGDVSFEDIVKEFGEYEARLNRLYESSTLPMRPPTKEIRALLLNVLEDHYGTLKECVQEEDLKYLAIKEIKNTLNKYNL